MVQDMEGIMIRWVVVSTFFAGLLACSGAEDRSAPAGGLATTAEEAPKASTAAVPDVPMDPAPALEQEPKSPPAKPAEPLQQPIKPDSAVVGGEPQPGDTGNSGYADIPHGDAVAARGPAPAPAVSSRIVSDGFKAHGIGSEDRKRERGNVTEDSEGGDLDKGGKLTLALGSIRAGLPRDQDETALNNETDSAEPELVEEETIETAEKKEAFDEGKEQLDSNADSKTTTVDSSGINQRRVDKSRRSDRQEVVVDERPAQFLPPMFYFENTYLGGNAAYLERMRRIWEKNPELASAVESLLAYPQQFDVPENAGMALVADLDRTHFDGPGRVFLQVGLRGSDRYGWRRPPLDIGLVLALGPHHADAAIDAVQTLMNRLGPQDRLSIVEVSQTPVLVADLDRIKKVRARLSWGWKPTGGLPTSPTLVAGLQLAADSLRRGETEDAVVVGTKTLLVVTETVDSTAAVAAASEAHRLTVEGFVTSVIEVRPVADGELWQVADAGHGGYHRADSDGIDAAVDAELSMLSRVVARLLRLNIRLSKSAHCVRVLGAKVLTAQQVIEVKARESATDQQLSKTMGIKADRGQDDDGAQTVIPYFLGGDSHVVVLELWVDEPGLIADITLKYKDMVHLRNGTAKTAVSLRNHKRAETPRDLVVKANLEGIRLGESLTAMAEQLQSGRGWESDRLDLWRRSRLLTQRDQEALEKLNTVATNVSAEVAIDALLLGAARKAGQPSHLRY